MTRSIPALSLLALLLAGCVRTGVVADRPTHLQIIAFNDFHGHIGADDQTVLPPGAASDAPRVKAGGAVNFAAAVARLRADNPQSAVVTAGDLISASPLVSGHFLDEPTIRVMNDIGVDFSALGNHEFDRGQQEIARIQSGGCAKYTLLEPCRVLPDFPGASFRLLAANVRKSDGTILLQPYGIKTLEAHGRTVRIGFVGMPLKGAPAIVSPAGVAGLTFADEAETANALIPELRRAGADILVMLVHEGGTMKAGSDPTDCRNMLGDINPILARLDPAFDLVISGHTHQAYICNYGAVDPSRPFLVSSAGQYGTLITRITLDYDERAKKLVGKRAENILVAQTDDAAARQPAIADLVARYEAATEGVRDRVVGMVAGPLPNKVDPSGQTVLGNLIADAQRAAMAAPDKGGAQIGLMNGGGVRAPIIPRADGAVTFGDIYTAQPFGNLVVVKALTGAQLKAALEVQLQDPELPRFLSPSQGFTYSYDKSRPAGQRVLDVRLDGRPLSESASYRVAMNSFTAQGGDGFPMFGAAPLVAEGPSDLDALEAYIVRHPGLQPPALDRIRDVTPG